MKQFIHAPSIEEMCKEIIKEENIDIGNAALGCFLVTPYVSKTIAGQCVKTNDRLRFFSTYDYIIEMSESVWKELDEVKQKILCHHELLHIHVVRDENSGEVKKYGLKDHNIKDFREVIERHGLDWIDTLSDLGATKI